MTISTIDPAAPADNDPAGQGDDQLRAFKQAVVDQFAGQAGDLYDIPVTAGPRSLNAVDDKANQTDLDAVDARVSTLETNDGTQDTNITDHENRIAAIEADYTTASQAAGSAWPVGSIFVSLDGGTPASKGLPGNWSAVGDGRVLIGAASGHGGQSGNANHQVSLSVGQIPPHKHAHTTYREDSSQGASTTPAYAYTSPSRSLVHHRAGRDQSSSEWAEFNTDEGIGTGTTPVNVQPDSLIVRFFERTS